MVLTIPVEDGYKGGCINIEHEGKSKSFQFEKDSDRLFSIVAFRVDCAHNLEPVSDGWMVSIVFHLVWKDVAKVADSSLDFPVFLKAFDIVKDEMARWLKNGSPTISESINHMEIDTTPKVEDFDLPVLNDRIENDQSGNQLIVITKTKCVI